MTCVLFPCPLWSTTPQDEEMDPGSCSRRERNWPGSLSPLLRLCVAFSLWATHCARLLANPSDLLPLVLYPAPLGALARAVRRGATDLSALDRLAYAAAALGWFELQVPKRTPPPPPCPLPKQSACRFLVSLQHKLFSRISNYYLLRRSSAALASYQRKAWASAVLCTSSE